MEQLLVLAGNRIQSQVWLRESERTGDSGLCAADGVHLVCEAVPILVLTSLYPSASAHTGWRPPLIAQAARGR